MLSLRKLILLVATCSMLSLTMVALADSRLTIEEQRLSKAESSMPGIFSASGSFLEKMKGACLNLTSFDSVAHCLSEHGDELWALGKQHVTATFDDRFIYWARLESNKLIRTAKFSFRLSPEARLALIEKFEHHSRGRNNLQFDESIQTHILLTGFDPFLLDRHIDQSNPSGIAALKFDDQIILLDGKQAQIQTVLFPVRYVDFDAGELEDLLAPYYKENSVDMIVTVSMGRDEFDLEHFPGRRRSSKAPDNLNVYSGGNEENPVIPSLHGGVLEGDEFYEFSLPYEAMQSASDGASYKINDRRIVTTLEATVTIDDLSELKGAIAVRGGGGGYLSNEISYRSVRLANQLGSTIPTGHIHTPRIASFDIAAIKRIVNQLESMLANSITAL